MMRLSLHRLLWSYLSGLAVLIAAFWITLQLIVDPDPWAGHPHSPDSAIQVVEGSYGLNCLGFKPSPGLVNSVKAGNATPTICEVCENALETCEFYADLGKLPD